jgi:hypothetical protein
LTERIFRNPPDTARLTTPSLIRAGAWIAHGPTMPTMAVPRRLLRAPERGRGRGGVSAKRGAARRIVDRIGRSTRVGAPGVTARTRPGSGRRSRAGARPARPIDGPAPIATSRSAPGLPACHRARRSDPEQLTLSQRGLSRTVALRARDRRRGSAEDRRLCPILAPRSDRADGGGHFPPKSSFNQSQGVVDIRNGRQERLEDRTSEIFDLSSHKP